MEQAKKEFNAINKQIAELKKVCVAWQRNGVGACALRRSGAPAQRRRVGSGRRRWGPGRAAHWPADACVRGSRHRRSCRGQQQRPCTPCAGQNVHPSRWLGPSVSPHAAIPPFLHTHPPTHPLTRRLPAATRRVSHPLPQAKQDAAEQMEASKEVKARIADLEAKEKEVGAARDAALVTIGNLVHDSVPVSDDEVRVRARTGCDRGLAPAATRRWR